MSTTVSVFRTKYKRLNTNPLIERGHLDESHTFSKYRR